LKDLTAQDSGIIFNQFAEILRHNIVSDKPNAFNKILNMFICKIIDEDRDENEELQFQILEEDDDKSLQMRLNNLYKEGMDKFLNIKVSDYDDVEINRLLSENNQNSDLLRKIYEDLRLKKNPAFAFKEVYDDQSFNENAIVVREVVELLQNYKFKYNHKQQFLGNFFELLLNTSIKQESGQFFTPVPVAKFIIKSLPIKELIENKIKNNDIDFLPYVIDYAAGSGHFLTEYMDEVQRILTEINNNISSYKVGSTIKKKISSFIEDPFSWAKQNVYGIDADYRLVKTAKVASFLNGDGEANIIRANGLDNFYKSKDYIGKLHSEKIIKDNEEFDILIANPPYSVNAFKSTIKDGSDSFELFDEITDNSSEIECLFIERMKQLLKVGGYAGIILPSTILSKNGIYEKTRKIIFDNFDILGIVELGKNTFMATDISTVILFLRKKESFINNNIKENVKKFFTTHKDITINGIENPINKYVNEVWEISIDDYIHMLDGITEESVKNNKIYQSYEKNYKDNLIKNILKMESEKIYHYILTYVQKIVIVKTGIKDKEKEFLGYEFSSKRGMEGIHSIKRGLAIDESTKLYDVENIINENKANTYIYSNFLDKNIKIAEQMSGNISYEYLSNLLTFSSPIFTNDINIKKKQKIKSNWPIFKIGDFVSTLYGYTAKAENTGDYRYLRITDINEDGSIKLDNDSKYVNVSKEDKEKYLLENDDILIARSGSVGKSTIYKDKKYENMIFASYLIRLRITDHRLLPDYLFYLTKSKLYWDQVHEKSIAVTQSNLNAEKIKDISIPVPTLTFQEEIIKKLKEIDDIKTNLRIKCENLDKEIESEIIAIYKNTKEREILANLCIIKNGGTPSTKRSDYWDGDINWATLVDTKDKYLYSTKRKITKEGVKNSNAKILPINTVLLSSRATIGDISIAKVETATNQGYKNFICNPNVLNYEYLYYILKHESENIKELASGMTYPEISKAKISQLSIPIPNIEKQNEFVSKVLKIEKEKENFNNEIRIIGEKASTMINEYIG
ncbi:MAG TPA: N-6 DNA methylase, partial [Gallicola sp.]|nr:N-6 DNA methylase [Gallicola sp.]